MNQPQREGMRGPLGLATKPSAEIYAEHTDYQDGDCAKGPNQCHQDECGVVEGHDSIPLFENHVIAASTASSTGRGL